MRMWSVSMPLCPEEVQWILQSTQHRLGLGTETLPSIPPHSQATTPTTPITPWTLGTTTQAFTTPTLHREAPCARTCPPHPLCPSEEPGTTP
ncbi:hypothetical protein QTP86_034801 [Hemibagrus guttatus]|nr:hypothetical protein QTP86_034801 [Hemibagrus guttatus]